MYNCLNHGFQQHRFTRHITKIGLVEEKRTLMFWCWNFKYCCFVQIPIYICWILSYALTTCF